MRTVSQDVPTYLWYVQIDLCEMTLEIAETLLHFKYCLFCLTRNKDTFVKRYWLTGYRRGSNCCTWTGINMF